MMVFEAVVVVSLIFAAISFAKSASDSDEVIKQQIANDLGLMVNVLLGLPGDASLQYPTDVSKFNILLENNKITVMGQDEPAHLHAIRAFVLPKDWASLSPLIEKKN